MDRKQVEAIFDTLKEELFSSKVATKNPVAYIFGGQPAVGKSNLEKKIDLSFCNILPINGDNYRVYHPDFISLVSNPTKFPSETQIFSNVFTEGLIRESIKRRVSVSVEGTMRRPEIVLNTASMFRAAGYRTEALCIVAPIEYSSVNTFHRYAQSLDDRGIGRLASLESIQETAKGIPNTLNELHRQKAVDTIRIFDIYAQRELKKYNLVNGKWDDMLTPPSVIVNSAIHNQKHNPELLSIHQKRAEQTLGLLTKNAPNLVSVYSKVIEAINLIAQGVKNKLNNPENIL